MARSIFDGDDVEAHRTILDVAITKEVVSGAQEHFVLFFGDAEFGSSGLIFGRTTGAHFDDGQGVAIEADQVDFAFGMGRGVIASDENIAEAPQVPVSIRFPAHAYLQRLELICLRRGRCWITESWP